MKKEELVLLIVQKPGDIAEYLLTKEADLLKFLSTLSIDNRIAELEKEIADVPGKQRELDELKAIKETPEGTPK